MADYNSVIRRCVREMASEGLKVRYPSGVKRRLDTAVRQNVLDGVREVNAESMRILGEGYGADGVEIDAHGLCADDHLPYQGRQYTLKQFERIQDSLERPFGKWNCKHNIHYIILGVSPRAYDDAELAEMERSSTEQITIDGVTKSRYEWSQTMRRLETRARYQNDETEALRAIGDKQGAKLSDQRSSRIVDAYDDVCRATGLEPRYDRMYVGRSSGPQRLNQSSEYGIIEEQNERLFSIYSKPARNYRHALSEDISKLKTSEDIRKYFEYRDEDGDKYSPVDENFGRLPIETQRQAAEGIKYARELFNLDHLPNVISIRKMGKAYGQYDEGVREMYLRNTISTSRAFSTAVHEMVHYADNVYGYISKSVVEEAAKNLGLDRRSKDYRSLAEAEAGKYKDDPKELCAYSIESCVMGKGNVLAQEIYRLFLGRTRG